MGGRKFAGAIPAVEVSTPLPEIPEGKLLRVFESSFGNAEREFALGIITTAAIRGGKWMPVDTKTFGEILNEGAAGLFPQGIANAIWALADDGYLDVVQVNGQDYIIPYEKLANVLTNARLMIE